MHVIVYLLVTLGFSFLSSASKQYKAAIIRIDSPGGDALASDL